MATTKRERSGVETPADTTPPAFITDAQRALHEQQYQEMVAAAPGRTFAEALFLAYTLGKLHGIDYGKGHPRRRA